MISSSSKPLKSFSSFSSLLKLLKEITNFFFLFSDHHKDQWPPNLKVNKKVELVGSCSTLVAEKLLMMDVLDSQITGLLVGTILLDTVNLDPRAGRVTDKDKEIVEQLQDKYPVALDELYKSLSTGWFILCATFRTKDFRTNYYYYTIS